MCIHAVCHWPTKVHLVLGRMGQRSKQRRRGAYPFPVWLQLTSCYVSLPQLKMTSNIPQANKLAVSKKQHRFHSSAQLWKQKPIEGTYQNQCLRKPLPTFQGLSTVTCVYLLCSALRKQSIHVMVEDLLTDFTDCKMMAIRNQCSKTWGEHGKCVSPN